MKKDFFCIIVLIFSVYLSISLQQEASYEGKNTLVIVDDFSMLNTFSKFFNSLNNRGYDLVFATPNDPNIRLEEFGEFIYDNLIVFAPNSEEYTDSIDSDIITLFIDHGNDVLIAGSNGVSYIVEEIAENCGVSMDTGDSYVIDHLNFDESDYDGQHTLIVANGFSENIASILGTNKIDPVLYRGIGMSLDRDNSLVFPLLRGSTSSYSHSPTEPITNLEVSGKSLVLVAGLQARNNARVSISGSIELFSDEFFDHDVVIHSTKEKFKSGNELFATELAKWTFHERGLIRLSNPKHSREDGVTPDIYSVKEEIHFSCDIEEWNGQEWIPYISNDVQLEFVMLDPYYRINLSHDNNGHYTTSFIAPDVYGVFTFKIFYFRMGYTSLEYSDITTVRPYLHNEYERFIPAAFPYYASAFSMMAGVLLFSVIFLFNKDRS
eukprot:TRINITY_DN14397_c0_g1_i1.p1 TRINITY_DN14397_c0_g1~~TRINITY_DN14397_c0_g1_i1.p1  ORF type:complete len:436 (-),score=136.60 TRINITY_DN14397_c0_g1_i1:74-1381(-)